MSKYFIIKRNPNLGEGGVNLLPPCLSSQNDSKTVKTVTLTEYSI